LDRVLYFCPVPASDNDLFTYASRMAGNTGLSHHGPRWDGVSITFFVDWLHTKILPNN
jgi:hypothetical protein